MTLAKHLLGILNSLLGRRRRYDAFSMNAVVIPLAEYSNSIFAFGKRSLSLSDGRADISLVKFPSIGYKKFLGKRAAGGCDKKSPVLDAQNRQSMNRLSQLLAAGATLVRPDPAALSVSRFLLDTSSLRVKESRGARQATYSICVVLFWPDPAADDVSRFLLASLLHNAYSIWLAGGGRVTVFVLRNSGVSCPATVMIKGAAA